MVSKTAARPTASQRQLIAYFEDGGCVRTPRKERLLEGSDSYKKGWEVRLVARSRAEVGRLRGLLQGAGLTAGSPYRKSKAVWIVPVYGWEQVSTFLGWIDSSTGR